MPEDGVQPSRWPRLFPELLHCARAAGALSPQPDPINTARRSRALLTSAALASAAHAPAAVHAQKGCRNPARSQGLAGFANGRACWRPGCTWGKLSACFCTSPPFLYFSPSLPAVTELQGFHQPCAESNAWHFWAQTTAEAGTDIFFISCP